MAEEQKLTAEDAFRAVHEEFMREGDIHKKQGESPTEKQRGGHMLAALAWYQAAARVRVLAAKMTGNRFIIEAPRPAPGASDAT